MATRGSASAKGERLLEGLLLLREQGRDFGLRPERDMATELGLGFR